MPNYNNDDPLEYLSNDEINELFNDIIEMPLIISPADRYIRKNTDCAGTVNVRSLA